MSQTDANGLYDEIERKQRRINNLLLDLSKIIDDDEKVLSIGKNICAIYRSNLSNGSMFRHQYHYLFDIVKEIKSPDLMDVLMANLKKIIEDNRDEDIVFMLLKLFDHISIDIVRISIENETHGLDSRLSSAKAELEDLTKKNDSLRKEVESNKMEMVAVLGVFAAIVIGFTGGLDVMGGALSNVGVKDFPLILFSVSLCGLVLFDVLWLLLECVMHIVKGRRESVIGCRAVLLFDAAMVVLMVVAFSWNMLSA